MKNVSNQFKEVIENGGPFYAYAEITLSNGIKLELNSEEDFFPEDNRIEESGGGGFPLGVALSRTTNLNIDNSDDRYSGYDFYYAKITLYTEADLPDGTTERIKEGTFTVTEPASPGDVIEIVAYDDMYKANTSCTLTEGGTALYVLQRVCSECGINLGSASFKNDDFEITSIPAGLTYRQVIGYIAMIACGNAVMDENNRLIIKSYDFTDVVAVISGGTFGDNLTDAISGGTFGDGATEAISGGNFSNSQIHIISDFPESPDVSTDDVVITGIRMDSSEEGETVTHLYGTEDYALTITNDLVSGKEDDLIKLIGDTIIGAEIRPFSGNFFPDPTIQFMDIVYIVDRKENAYQSFICENVFNFLSSSSLSNTLESPLRNDSVYNSQATEAYRKAREEVEKSKTEWEKAMEELSQRVENSSGLYMTEEKQEDGSTIYYLHNKPTIEESMIIWKMTAESFAVSNDGGKTYTAGLTVDGTLIASILNTIGVNADWIRVDDLSALNATIGGWDINDEGLYKTFKINEDNYLIFIKKPSTISETREDVIGIYRTDEEGNMLSKIFNIDSLGGYSNYHYGESGLSDSSLVIDGGDITFYDEEGNVVGYIEVYSDYLQIGGAKEGGFLQFTVEKSASSNLSFINTTSSFVTNGNILSTSLKSDIVTCLSLSATQYKNRIVNTENYGEVRQYSYETTYPIFGDVGQGYINSDGECFVAIDDVFLETLTPNCEYQVFLQKEGPGDLWVSKKEQNYFVVKGTTNLKFAWEIKGVQINCETERLESFDIFKENIKSDEKEMEGVIDEEINKFLYI